MKQRMPMPCLRKREPTGKQQEKMKRKLTILKITVLMFVLTNGLCNIAGAIEISEERSMGMTFLSSYSYPSPWALTEVQDAINLGLVPATIQQRYTRAATRSDFCALAASLYEAVTGITITARSAFIDTNDVNAEKMAAIGVVNGTSPGVFDPGGTITREQAAVMISRLAAALNVPLPVQEPPFSDNGDISAWAFESVGNVRAAGIMSGVGESTFSPQGPYTREQSIVSIKRLFDTVKRYIESKNFRSNGAGYAVDLPPDMKADMSKSPLFTAAQRPGAKIVISRERAQGSDVTAYVEHYFHRFILNEVFRRSNGIELIKNEKAGSIQTITLKLNDYAADYDMYTYLTVLTGSEVFYRVMIKFDSSKEENFQLEQMVKESFCYFKPEGVSRYDLDYHPVIPEGWSSETRGVYDDIASAEELKWGVTTGWTTAGDPALTAKSIEKKLDYKFDVMLYYVHMNHKFPAELMSYCHSEGRLVELTYQMTSSYNMNLFSGSLSLDLYRRSGARYEACVESIREFARSAKEFGHPFLFRLNNEMNSDWTSYSGVVNLLDPDIYIDNWRLVYRIFQEEGVNNAIWIFNPNDKNFPPNNWNNSLAYYPGNGYVHMLGITGYNTGSYYNSVTGEKWSSFKEIYDNIQRNMGEVFSNFPWIITEFASSSVGGDKAKWITEMFDRISEYPNIKIAVWYNSADYDPGDPDVVSRPYWIDETPETLSAFKRGLHYEQHERQVYTTAHVNVIIVPGKLPS